MHARRLRVSGRFAVVLVGVVMAIGAVGWAGVDAVGTTHASLDRIYTDNVVTSERISELGTRLARARQQVVAGLLLDDAAEQQRIAAGLTSSALPQLEVMIDEVNRLVADNPVQRRLATALRARWAAFTALYGNGQLSGSGVAARQARARELTAALDAVSAQQQQLFATESIEAANRERDAEADYHHSLWLMLVIAGAGLGACVLIVMWLIRSTVPRVRSYASFAQRMADGDYSGRLEPTGVDEIARLGRTLDEVAQRRQQDDAYDRTQGEFTAALQITSDEHEAQDLLRRHLERSLPDSSVTVLNRNNSADRLEAVTALAEGSPLGDRLSTASPRSCLAIRSATVHTSSDADQPLVACEVCSGCGRNTTCMPLLVGGEVIGAVLAAHDSPLGEDSGRRLRDSVAQAAPIVANLRNLAISQVRAATDPLTGLPNRRTLDDTIKRMVGQASRANQRLAALMVDLDHFKALNDEFGHAKGDEMLALFGALLREHLRTSDFAGRYGGEEFLVLLPATGADGALTAAEKLRHAVERLRLPGIDGPITASIGVAVVPDHALDSDGLQRAADRALYLAKTRGRNRTQLASAAAGPGEPMPVADPVA